MSARPLRDYLRWRAAFAGGTPVAVIAAAERADRALVAWAVGGVPRPTRYAREQARRARADDESARPYVPPAARWRRALGGAP